MARKLENGKLGPNEVIKNFGYASEYVEVQFKDLVVGDVICGDPHWGSATAVVVKEIKPRGDDLLDIWHGGDWFSYYPDGITYKWDPKVREGEAEAALAELEKLV